MARQRRTTQPVNTVHGTLTDYVEIERYLVDAEMKGRAWVFAQAKASPGTIPSDEEVKSLHREMFDGLFDWAGRFRTIDVGPGGNVNVPWHEVPTEMRKFAGDLAAWIAGLSSNPTAADIAIVLADAHHRFQWIHPFQDTNGRTGRVFDLYLLWVTFKLAGEELASTPIIEPFPSDNAADEYYEGLAEADGHVFDRLRRYYVDRLLSAIDPGESAL